jgi:putative ABC transport system permease protein
MSRRLSAQARKSIADVVGRRAHSLLVVVAILIAVGGLTAVNVADGALSAAYAFTASSQGLRPDLVVAVDKADASLLSDLSRLPAVTSVQQATTMATRWRVAAAPGHVSFSVITYPDLQHVPLTPFQLVQGRYPGTGEIVMEYGDSGLQPFAVGDTVTLDTAQGGAALRVVGIARTSGLNPAVTGKAVGYMSTAGLLALPAFSYVPGQVPRQPMRADEISLKLRSPAEYRASADAVAPVVRAHGASVLAVFPPEHGATLDQLKSIFSLVRLLMAVALLLAGILLLNTITALIAEQTAVIATMKALGATRARIVRGYCTTVLIYSAVATPVGLAAGVAAGHYLGLTLAASIPLAAGPFELPPSVVGLGLGVGFGVPIVAALIPLWLGTRISVRQALAAWGVAGVEAEGAGVVARLFAGRLGRVPQTVWLGLRGLFRKPWRAALSVATVSIAAVCFLVVQSMAASVSGSIASVWGNFSADTEIYGGENATYSGITAMLKTVPNVGRVERVGWLGAQTAWGKVAVWGVEPDSRLYHHEMTSGRWFTAQDSNVVLLGDQMAARAGLHAGSTFTLTGPGGARRVSWTVVGTVRESVDDLSQAGAVVAPVNEVYELGGADPGHIGDFTNRLLVQAADRSPGAVDRLTRDVDAVGRAAMAGGREGPIAEVFRFSDEVVRHQRNFMPLYALLVAVAVVVAAVGVLGLADALGASVVERQRDIGLLRSLGASGRRVAQVFWVEGLALSAVAWLLASLVGVPLAYLFVGLFRRLIMPIDFHFDPLAFAVMLAATVAIATLATVVPAVRAASLRAVDLLRYQ